MIFTCIENVSYITEIPKFIEIERNDDRSLYDFVKELKEISSYEKLQPVLDTNLQGNYDTFIHLVSSDKNKHFPKKVAQFNEVNDCILIML